MATFSQGGSRQCFPLNSLGNEHAGSSRHGLPSSFPKFIGSSGWLTLLCDEREPEVSAPLCFPRQPPIFCHCLRLPISLLRKQTVNALSLCIQAYLAAENFAGGVHYNGGAAASILHIEVSVAYLGSGMCCTIHRGLHLVGKILIDWLLKLSIKFAKH